MEKYVKKMNEPPIVSGLNFLLIGITDNCGKIGSYRSKIGSWIKKGEQK